MAESKHPYIPSAGVIIKTIDQFRKMFPAKIDSSILKKLSLAPNNEGIVISTFKYLGFIDDKGIKTDLGKSLFLIHDDGDFSKEFEKVVLNAYKDLFDLQGEQAWKLDRNTLIGFFRATDGTSELTATRQAIAFETLSSISGHGAPVKMHSEPAKTKPINSAPPVKSKQTTNSKPQEDQMIKTPLIQQKENLNNDIGLTVRIEINLPAQGDQDTYDKIFLSIKKNLLNG